MDPRFKAAMTILTLTALAGVWLFVAPFLLEYQAIGADWISATTQHVATGAVLTGASLAALFASWALALRAISGAAADQAGEPPATRQS